MYTDFFFRSAIKVVARNSVASLDYIGESHYYIRLLNSWILYAENIFNSEVQCSCVNVSVP